MTEAVTTQEELWLCQQRPADIHAWDLGDERGSRRPAGLVYLGAHAPPSLAVQPASGARVTFLRLTGKSCLFVREQMFPLL